MREKYRCIRQGYLEIAIVLEAMVLVWCGCGEVQNAAHLLAGGCVKGMRREWRDMWTDREFCAEVSRFLGQQSEGGGAGR